MATLSKRKRKQREIHSVGYSPRKKQSKTEHQKIKDLYKRNSKSIRIRLKKLIDKKKPAVVKGPDQVFLYKWFKQSDKTRTAGFGELIKEHNLVVTDTKIYSQGKKQLNGKDLRAIVTFILARGIDDEDDYTCQKAQILAGVLPKDEDIVENIREHFQDIYCNKSTYIGVEKRLTAYNYAIDIVKDLDKERHCKISDKLRTWMEVNNFTDFCVDDKDDEEDDEEDDKISCASTLVVSDDSDDSDDSSIDIMDFMPTEEDGEISTYDRIKSLSGIRIAALQSKINEVIEECDQVIKDHRRANERRLKKYNKEERKKNDIDARFVPQTAGGIQNQKAEEMRRKYEYEQEIKERYEARVARIQAAKAVEDSAEYSSEDSAEEDLTFYVPEIRQGAPSDDVGSPLKAATVDAWGTLASPNQKRSTSRVAENTDEATHIRTSQARV